MSYRQEVLNDSPLMFWECKDTSGTTIADSSGNGSTGTTHNTPTLNQTDTPITSDPASRSISFTASSSQYISGALQPYVAGSQRTYEMWAKQAGFSVNHALFAGGFGQVLCSINANSNDLFYRSASAGTSATWGTSVPNAGNWFHLVLTVDDQSGTGFRKARLYVNNVDQTEKTGLAAYGDNTEVFQVGANSTASWDGKLTMVAVYSGLLSAARVSAHHTAATQVSMASPTRRRNHMVRR